MSEFFALGKMFQRSLCETLAIANAHTIEVRNLFQSRMELVITKIRVSIEIDLLSFFGLLQMILKEICVLRVSIQALKHL